MKPEKLNQSNEQDLITHESESSQTKKMARIAIEETVKGKKDIKIAPEGWFSLRGLEREIGKTRKTTQKKIDELGIEGKEFRDKTGSNITIFYSPEQKDEICASFGDLIKLKQAPDGYAPLAGLPEALDINVAEGTIEEKIKELEPIGEFFLNKNGRKYKYYSPEEQKRIKELFKERQSMEQAPDSGYYTINSMCQSIDGVGFHTVEKIINVLALPGKPFMDKGKRIFTYYSEEQRQRVINYIEDSKVAEEATKDELSLRGLAKKFNVDKETVKRRIEILQSDGEEFGKVKKKHNNVTVFYSLEEQNIIKDALEHCLTWTSIPESTVAFYFVKMGFDVKLNIRPNWLKNSDTNHNLEVDIFCPTLGVGIEYDGFFYHQDVEHDMKKDRLARNNGYRIIHIRENGCPEMSGESSCIKRKDNDDDKDLEECIIECFRLMGISGLDIDIARDKNDIMAFMRQRVLKVYNAAKKKEDLHNAS